MTPLQFYTRVFLFSLVLNSPLIAYAKAPEWIPCTQTNNETGNFYDLRPLIKDSGEDWKIDGYEGDLTFELNICHSLLDNEDKKDAGARVKGKKIDNFLGKTNSTPFFRGDKLLLEYKDGDPCPNRQLHRTTLISFTCDNTIQGFGDPKFIGSSNDCGYWFEWRTPVACPTNKAGDGMGGWGVFFTIFLIALIVYFVGGIVYNRMVHNAVGVNQIPNWEFWSNIKDVALMLFSQCPGSRPRRAPRNYRNLPGDEEHILIDEEIGEH